MRFERLLAAKRSAITCVMDARKLSRLSLFWLGLLALVASTFQQAELAYNVVNVAVQEAGSSHHGTHAYHVMPDGTVMADGAMDASATAGGHTHRGHADCKLCGVEAALSFVTFSLPPVVPRPAAIARRMPQDVSQALTSGWATAAYSPRAPPSLMS
jgi:hypothetical protein